MNMLNSNKAMPVIHKKTGNIYFVLSHILDCTNATADRPMVLYGNTEGMLFCREEKEFWEKFEAAGNYEFVHRDI